MSDSVESRSRAERYVIVPRLVIGIASIAVAIVLAIVEWSAGALDQRRAAIASIVVPFVFGAALIGRSFGRGCRRCRRPLETIRIRFPAETYEALRDAVDRGGAKAIAELHTLPSRPLGEDAATLRLERCPSCGGAATLSALRAGVDSSAGEASRSVSVSPEVVSAVEALGRARKIDE